MIEKINAGNGESVESAKVSNKATISIGSPSLDLSTFLPLHLCAAPYLDQVGSVTLPRPLMTGTDFPVGTSSREIVLPVL